MTLDRGVNGHSFQVFLEKILLPKLWPGACVVLDNLSVHKVKGVKEKIESVGATLIYLSPYSPDFNPIESCWSKLLHLGHCILFTIKHSIPNISNAN